MEPYEQVEWFCHLSPLAIHLIKLIQHNNRSLSLKWGSELYIYRLWQILQAISTNYGEHYDMTCVHNI